MKRILLFIFLFVLFFPFSVFAADEFYCKCSSPILEGGRKCLGGFTSTSTAKDACPLCTLSSGDVTADKDCSDEVVAGPSGSSSADSAKTVKLNNPLAGNVTDVNTIIGNVIKAALGVMGALMLLMIVWGGFSWLTAAGNPEKIKAGSNKILWAILGSIVVLASYMLLNVVLRALAG